MIVRQRSFQRRIQDEAVAQDLPALLLASSRPGTRPRVKGGRRPSRSDASGSEHP
jgi:hypothetical protein